MSSTSIARRRWRWPAVLVGTAVLGVMAGHASRLAARAPAMRTEDPGSGASRSRDSIVVGDRRVAAVPAMPRRTEPENPMLVPGAPAYSPAHAAMATELGSFEVFERERRDEAFAGRREQFLREHATVVFERHGPEVRLASLECRSGACLVTLDAPDTPWSRTLAGAISWGRLQDMRVHEPVDGRILIEIATLMDRELLHHATYERYLTDWRRTMAADLDHLRASMHDAQAGE